MPVLVDPNAADLPAFAEMVAASAALDESFFARWHRALTVAPDRYLRLAEKDRLRGLHRVWLRENGRIVGAGSAAGLAPTLFGHVGIFVHPVARGRGLGRFLASEMAQLAHVLGAAKPTATIEPGNAASRRALLAAGAVAAAPISFGREQRDVFVFPAAALHGPFRKDKEQ